MWKKLQLFLFKLLILWQVHGECAPLSERILKAKGGEYIVTHQGAHYSLLLIKEVSGDIVTFEEISIPKNLIQSKGHRWKKWLEEGAKGNTSWIGFSVDLAKHCLIEGYSFTKGSWLYLDPKDNFFVTLLDLNVLPTPQHERRRIGPEPKEDGPDNRALWNPPKYQDNHLIRGSEFLPVKGTWPKDGSPLAGCSVELYFDGADPDFPLPGWIEISATHKSTQIHVCESGKDLISPQKKLPRRSKP